MQQNKNYQPSDDLIISPTSLISDPGYKFIRIDLKSMEDEICNWITYERISSLSAAEDDELEDEILDPIIGADSFSGFSAAGRLEFRFQEELLEITLPSGRLLRFQNPSFHEDFLERTTMSYFISSTGCNQGAYRAVTARELLRIIIEAITRDVIKALMHSVMTLLDAQIVKLSQNSFVFQVAHYVSIDDLQYVLDILPPWAHGLEPSAYLYESPTLFIDE